MKILLIGGSYFLGRVFVLMAHSKHELTLLNRGHYSMASYVHQEFTLDRHDLAALASLPAENYDVIIDCCAYEKGDIETFCTHFPGTFQHYLLISTVDVYKHRTDKIQDEDQPYEDLHYAGEVGQYIDGKIQVEKELIALAQSQAFSYTILRPGMIYGPFNYAPRESALIARACQDQPLYHFANADGTFQLVYVKDVARAILQVIHKPTQAIFNVVSPEKITYHQIASRILSALDKEALLTEQDLDTAIQEGYPLPFPLFSQECESYDSSRLIDTYDFQYTPFDTGMNETVQAFLPVFMPQK